jgi:hypothetical protein
MSNANQKGGGSAELPIEADFNLKQERTFEPKKSTPVERSEISFIDPPGPDEVEIPEQKQHFDLPVRFGAVPADKAPLGWEVETRRPEYKVTKFQHAYLNNPDTIRKHEAAKNWCRKRGMSFVVVTK